LTIMLWFDRHRRLRDQLSAYLDGALDAPAVQRVEAHLAECERCRAELDQLTATVAALKELPEVDLPRSFALTPERAAARRPAQPAPPLAFGMRLTAAGVAVALTAVLVADLGDIGGGGAPGEPSAPEMAAERQADQEDAAPAPGEGAGTPAVEMPAPDDLEETLRSDTDAAETPSAAPSPVPSVVPSDATVVPRGEEGAPFPRGLTPEPEAGIQEALPPPGGGGGIDALTAVEIGLAAALGVLVGGSLALAFVGRKR
jgi:hypothetical protein